MRTLMLVSLMAALGCASRGTPVAVEGPVPDVGQLVGEWWGSFESGATGRAGSIRFSLAAVADTAWGDVVMQPNDTLQFGASGRPSMPPPAALVLPIRFVRVEGDRVRGLLEPYRDPNCGCMVITTFEGTIRGDVISGRYLTEHRDHARVVEGTWEVRRQRPRV